MLQVYARRADLSLGGQLGRLGALDVTLRWNQVASWSISAVMSKRLGELLVPGAGIIIRDDRGVPLLSDDGVLLTGDVEEIGQAWSEDSTTDAAPGTITVSGGGDLTVVADELAFPNPTGADFDTASAGTTGYDARSGAAETVIKGYVADNIGAGRPAWRNDAAGIRLVTVAPDFARGSTVSKKARFDPLLELTRSLAMAGGSLGVRVVQNGSDLVFNVYEPTDRSTEIVFSKARRNLRAYSVSRSAPTTTHVVIGGANQAQARIVLQRRDLAAAAEWHRIIRTFVDQRQTDDVVELHAAGDEALDSGRRSGVLSATAVDTPRMRFGEHFSLGDLVGVEVEPGTTFVDRVTSARIVLDDKGIQPAQITIGNPDLDPQTPISYLRATQAQAEIAALQRRY